MKKNLYFAIDYYDRKVIELIMEKYNFEQMKAFRKFIMSKTHLMLEDSSYGLLSFSEYAVFDMWEAEQITGDPRESVYIRGE